MVEITALFWYNKHMETREKDIRELQALLAKKKMRTPFCAARWIG